MPTKLVEAVKYAIQQHDKHDMGTNDVVWSESIDRLKKALFTTPNNAELVAEIDIEAIIKECQHDARWQVIKDEDIENVIRWVMEYHPKIIKVSPTRDEELARAIKEWRYKAYDNIVAERNAALDLLLACEQALSPQGNKMGGE